MGLDMYAHKIRAALVEDQPQFGVPIAEIALKAVGFEVYKGDDFHKEPEGFRVSYYARQKPAFEKAKAEGIYVPDIAYWRKFNNLHGWMERLYQSKGGSETFNCVNVRLMTEDLDKLEKEAQTLAPTSGFFFGAPHPMTADDVEEVLNFVALARAAIADGYAVFYDSWW